MSKIDPIKVSSVYATFGQYYGKKLIRLLDDCCNSFCTTGRDCLGISATGNPNLVLNQQGEWVEITPTIDTDYESLIDDITNSRLVPNAYYEFDFQTVSYIQDFSVYPNEDIHTGAVERVRVKAISTNQLFYQLESLDFPTDIIYWTPSFANRYFDAVAGQATGVMTYRCDPIKKVSRDFDWRNVVFRRWETVNGSLTYDSLTNTGFGYFDYAAFPVGTEENICIGGLTDSGRADLGVPYYNDNTIILDPNTNGVRNIKITLGWLNTISDGSTDTTINTFIQNKINAIQYSNIVTCINNEFAGITHVQIYSASNNTGLISLSDSRFQQFNNNSSATAMTIDDCTITMCSYNDFDGYNVAKALGTGLLNCTIGGDLYGINFSVLQNVSLVNDFWYHTFLTAVDNMTITANADITSTTPTASRGNADNTEHFQEELNAGGTALSWTLIS